jgi:hypothetical protein
VGEIQACACRVCEWLEGVLGEAGAHRESRTPLFCKGMIEQRREPSSIVVGVDHARRNRISEDFRVVVEGLVEGPHDRGNFDGPASLGMFHRQPPEGESHLRRMYARFPSALEGRIAATSRSSPPCLKTRPGRRTSNTTQSKTPPRPPAAPTLHSSVGIGCVGTTGVNLSLRRNR